MVDESGIELEESGAGREFFCGIDGRHDAPDTDDRDPVTKVVVKAGDHLGGVFRQGSTRQSARLGVGWVSTHLRALNGGVGGDEGIETMIEKDPA